MTSVEKLLQISQAREQRKPSEAAVSFTYDPAKFVRWSVVVPWVEGTLIGETQEEAAGKAVRAFEAVEQHESEVPDTPES